MADAERSKVEGDAPGKPVKQREELDHLLQRIAAHIAEVDKGDKGPSEEAATPTVASHEGEGASNQLSGAPKALRAGASLRRAPSSIEPPALRSALGSSGLVKPGRGSSAKAVAASDNGDATPSGETPETTASGERAAARQAPGEDQRARVAEEPVGRADEPWDDATAEALTRTFEADLAVPPLRSMLDAMGGGSGGTIERRGSERRLSSAERGHDLGVRQHASDVEVAQGDLIQAARRVEAMLDRLAPREAVDALGARFTTLESEVGRAGAQLERLDGIEARLGALGDKLSDAQIVALFGSLVPTAEDLTHFAEDAAGRAAERVLEAHSRELAVHAAPSDKVAGSGSSSQLKALGELLATFMDERRRTDAGTLEALETLQLAMQHVLDRIDRVEEPGVLDDVPAVANRPVETIRDLDEEPAQAVSRSGDSMSAGIVNLTANQSAHSFEAHAYRMPDERPRDVDTVPDAPGYDEVGIRALSARDRLVEPIAEHSGFPHEASSRPPADRFIGPQSDGTAEAAPPPLSERQAFIAMARRAAERAKTEPANGSKGQIDKPAMGSTPADKVGNVAAGSSVGIIRPGVIAIAAGAVVLALLTGYWFLMGHRGGLPNVLKSAAIERVESAERESAAPAKPETEGEGNAPPADEAPAVPSKISDDAPAVPARDQQEASAIQVPDAAGPGMAVAFGQSPATFDTVMQARERTRLASLSQRTAFTAARSHGVPHGLASDAGDKVSPIETASVGVAAPATRVDEAPAAAKDQRQQLVLPPAAAGPLSLRLAAAQGDAAAQLEIATRLAEGKGIKQNFAEAASWYERAAAQSQPIAQYRLATLYERGMGVKADRVRARALYESAAEQGNLKAMHNLAVISTSPAAGNPDYDTAATLFTRAAGYGLADSQYNLGVLYESGLGVPKDHAAAYKWYSLAARGGDADAARRRDSLISRLPPETLQAMDKQIAAWRPVPADERANNPRAVGPTLQQNNAAASR